MQIKKTMMTLHEINKTYNRIVGSLDAKELKEAFDQTQSLIAGIRDYSFMDQLNELQNTYKYMLQNTYKYMLRYRLEGAKDPMEEQIYHQLIASAYLLADQVRNKALAVESPLIYYSRRRVLQKLPFPAMRNCTRNCKTPTPAVPTLTATPASSTSGLNRL